MLKFLLPLAFCLLPFSANAELRLIMFEQDGCFWCERWNEEISAIYPKTQEGRAAPLQRQDIFDPFPEDIAIKSRPAFTPTFVLLEDGNEVFRIEGYPGADFFWSLLEQKMAPLAEYKAAELDS
ncbi:MAG: hypothetical protein KUG74_07225 [Rhodobacteraceae bacterium]|nr:hypothetical protein [Paracoccaceae bacterium]